MPRKKADEPKLTLEIILNTAYALFASEGYEGTTLNQLSKLLNVSKPALYYYFDSKEKLFEVLYQSIAELIQKDLDQVLLHAQKMMQAESRNQETFKELIYMLGVNDFEGLSTNPNLAKVLRQFDLLRLRQANINEIAQNLTNYTNRIYEEIFSLGLEAQLYSSSEINYLKDIISALINGFNYEMIFEDKQVDLNAWRFALDRIL